MFSELVNEIAEITDRRGEEDFITTCCNGAVRELQSKGLFSQDMVEDRIETVGASTQPFYWRDVPRYLRAIQFVRYSNGVSPVPVTPGRKIDELAGNYYYFASDYIIFSGVPKGGHIDIAYYILQPRLEYYQDLSTVPARRNSETGEWEYRWFNPDTQNWEWVATLGSWEQDKLARMKVTNWLLEDYREAVKAIAVREIYNIFQDTGNSSVWTAIAANHIKAFLNLTKVKGVYT